MTITRRNLLKVSAAAGATAALVGLGRKSARGADPARARRVLILNASGGMRTTTAFHASPSMAFNPFGVLATAGALRLGNVLRADESVVTYAAPSWGAGVMVPPIDVAARNFAVIAATDHRPDGGYRPGDHRDDGARMGTGYYGRYDTPGLVTVLNHYLGAQGGAPVVVMGGSNFADAPPAWVIDTPIGVSFNSLPTNPPTGGSSTVGRPLEDALDARVLARRRNLAHDAVQQLVSTKGTLRQFGPLMADERLRFYSAEYDDRELRGITNRMLLEAVGNPNGDGMPGLDGDARNVALALRFLQMGSPAACVSIGGFDTHDHETDRAPPLFTRYARFLAGIHFALSRIPDPAGGMMLDSTLVVHTSEFGRNGVDPDGFNAGLGSDHGGDPGWRYQAHVVFGAGVVPKRLHDTDDRNMPLDRPASTHRLLATIAAATGIEQTEIDKLWPPRTALYPETGPMWELWA
ncbi:MAG TPA: DUF1501 domain-containing protein [Kofleriaceae bacterium]|nr:DUF1501 domain-containing protein [Kofleriaceae bacterium]